MPGLNVHADSDNSYATTKKKWNRGPKVILAVSLLLLIPVVGTSLASNGVVNGAPITFGQGYTAAIACSTPVTITPDTYFSYTNKTTYGWKINTITISGINTTDTDSTTGIGCGLKTLTIQPMLDGVATGPSLVLSIPSGEGSVTSSSPLEYSGGTSQGLADDTLIITYVSGHEIPAADVNGFTIQES